MKIKKEFIFPLGCLMSVFLGFIDHALGYEISFSIFYLLAILFVFHYETFAKAVIVAFFSSLIWLAADLMSGNRYSFWLIPFWNAFMRFGFFYIIIYLALKMRKEKEYHQQLSLIDPLTEILNSRSFFQQLTMARGRALRFNQSLTLVYIDVDNFKQVNDRFGHAKGDELLRLIAKAIQTSIRVYDVVARIGGDEFVLLLPETNKEQAQSVLSRIGENFIVLVKKEISSVSLSIGVATYQSFSYSVADMISMADQLMYDVKNNGKNNVIYRVF